MEVEQYFTAWNATNTPVLGTKKNKMFSEITIEERDDTHDFRVNWESFKYYVAATADSA